MQMVKTQNFNSEVTIIHNQVFKDPNLYASDRGVLCTILSLGGELEARSKDELCTELSLYLKDEESSIRKSILRLEAAGYIYVFQRQNNKDDEFSKKEILVAQTRTQDMSKNFLLKKTPDRNREESLHERL